MPRERLPIKKRTYNTLGEYTETLVTPEERDQMIAEAAYYRAEQHGFNPSCVKDDWYAAVKMVDLALFKEVEETEEH